MKATGADFLEAPFTGSKLAAEARKNVLYAGELTLIYGSPLTWVPAAWVTETFCFGDLDLFPYLPT